MHQKYLPTLEEVTLARQEAEQRVVCCLRPSWPVCERNCLQVPDGMPRKAKRPLHPLLG